MTSPASSEVLGQDVCAWLQANISAVHGLDLASCTLAIHDGHLLAIGSSIPIGTLESSLFLVDLNDAVTPPPRPISFFAESAEQQQQQNQPRHQQSCIRNVVPERVPLLSPFSIPERALSSVSRLSFSRDGCFLAVQTSNAGILLVSLPPSPPRVTILRVPVRPVASKLYSPHVVSSPPPPSMSLPYSSSSSPYASPYSVQKTSTETSISTSAGSPGLSGRSVRVVFKFHPLSAAHLCVLTPNAFLVFNVLISAAVPEQSVPLAASFVDFCFGCSEGAVFHPGIHSMWHLSVLLVSATGQICVITPIIPRSCLFLKDILSDLQQEVQDALLSLSSSNVNSETNSSTAQSFQADSLNAVVDEYEAAFRSFMESTFTSTSLSSQHKLTAPLSRGEFPFGCEPQVRDISDHLPRVVSTSTQSIESAVEKLGLSSVAFSCIGIRCMQDTSSAPLCFLRYYSNGRIDQIMATGLVMPKFKHVADPFVSPHLSWIGILSSYMIPSTVPPTSTQQSSSSSSSASSSSSSSFTSSTAAGRPATATATGTSVASSASSSGSSTGQILSTMLMHEIISDSFVIVGSNGVLHGSCAHFLRSYEELVATPAADQFPTLERLVMHFPQAGKTLSNLERGSDVVIAHLVSFVKPFVLVLDRASGRFAAALLPRQDSFSSSSSSTAAVASASSVTALTAKGALQPASVIGSVKSGQVSSVRELEPLQEMLNKTLASLAATKKLDKIYIDPSGSKPISAAAAAETLSTFWKSVEESVLTRITQLQVFCESQGLPHLEQRMKLLHATKQRVRDLKTQVEARDKEIVANMNASKAKTEEISRKIEVVRSKSSLQLSEPLTAEEREYFAKLEDIHESFLPYATTCIDEMNVRMRSMRLNSEAARRMDAIDDPDLQNLFRLTIQKIAQKVEEAKETLDAIRLRLDRLHDT
eukprot:ANDGO_08015.mRNA.1 hypothetical protein